MPRYEPIDSSITFQTSSSDLVGFVWGTNGIQAEFVIPGTDQQSLTVKFDRQCLVRILDEMALSTELDDTEDEGLISQHFAYIVHGASFFRMQSEAWKSGWESLNHYRFITGWACLDVISSAYPTFELRDGNTAEG
jgi:hypothetical protein